MKKRLIFLIFIIILAIQLPSFAAKAKLNTTIDLRAASRDCGSFMEFAQLCWAADCDGTCNQFTSLSFDQLQLAAAIWNDTHPSSEWVHIDPNLSQQCSVVDKPPAPESAAPYYASGEPDGGHHGSMGSTCPCPGGITVEQDGCSLVFKCSMAGSDHKDIVKVTTPCPTVSVFTPQYPLVKMMSFALVEWNDQASVEAPYTVSYGAPGGLGAPGAYVGAEVYTVDFDVIVSSVDIGTGEKFSISKANAQKNAKSILDRHNFEFILAGDNEYVEVLDQQDIYDAYKNHSKYVQSYILRTKHLFPFQSHI